MPAAVATAVVTSPTAVSVIDNETPARTRSGADVAAVRPNSRMKLCEPLGVDGVNAALVDVHECHVVGLGVVRQLIPQRLRQLFPGGRRRREGLVGVGLVVDDDVAGMARFSSVTR